MARSSNKKTPARPRRKTVSKPKARKKATRKSSPRKPSKTKKPSARKKPIKRPTARKSTRSTRSKRSTRSTKQKKSTRSKRSTRPTARNTRRNYSTTTYTPSYTTPGPDYKPFQYEEPKAKPPPKEIKTKGFYRSRSPTRKRGQHSRPDVWKNISFPSYMVETGHYGKDVVCLAASHIMYQVLERTFSNTMESVYWSIMDCPYTMVVIEIIAAFKQGEETHANLLLVNKTKSPWEIERFEPHGMVDYAESDDLYVMQERIDTSLKDWLTKVLGSAGISFVYKRPMDVCPQLGPQTRSERVSDLVGFCQTWTKFYWDARLSNPQLTGAEVLRDLFELPPEELFEMIQDYVHFVKDTVIPKEFEEFLNEKRLAVIGYESKMEDIRKLTFLDNNTKDEISHSLYTLISKVNDKETFRAYYEIYYYIGNLLSKEEYYKKGLQILKSLTGKKMKPNPALKDALLDYWISGKEAHWEKFVSTFTALYGPLM